MAKELALIVLGLLAITASVVDSAKTRSSLAPVLLFPLGVLTGGIALLYLVGTYSTTATFIASALLFGGAAGASFFWWRAGRARSKWLGAILIFLVALAGLWIYGVTLGCFAFGDCL